MKKKFDFKTIVALGICMFSLIAACGACIAWFTSVNINAMNITGSSQGAYFAYGNGKKAYDPNDPTTEEGDRPFGIANTRHLNNLAWLQYTGEFNRDRDGDGIIDHVYFELANDINATGETFTTLPIGTEDNPFIGVFDGNGHTIHNVKITNDEDSFSDMPRSIKEAQAEADQYHEEDAEIVGFFGVVGNIGGESYNEGVNNISDFTLDNVTVESVTDSTLIGVAAGYVNSEMSGVKVDNSSIITNGNSRSDYSGNLSDYGLVGYTTKKSSGTSGTFTQSISTYYNVSSGGSGGGTDWGEPLDTVSIYNNLVTKFNSATPVSEHQQRRTLDAQGDPEGPDESIVKSPDKYKNYRNGTNDSNWTESYCFRNHDITGVSRGVLSLSGKSKEDLVVVDKSQSTKTLFTLQPGTNPQKLFVPLPGQERCVGTSVVEKTDGEYPESSGWKMSNNVNAITNNAELGYLYVVYEGHNYYLNVTDTAKDTDNFYLALDLETPITQWTIEVGTYKYLRTRINSTNYYFRPQYRTVTKKSTQKQKLEFELQVSYATTTYKKGSNVYDDMYDTVFAHGTGYIVGGSTIDGGDVYLSRHNDHYYPISNATPLTIDASGVKNASQASFVAYDETYTNFKTMINNDPDSHYGLRFMDASISASDVVTLPTNNFQVPRNSLTFNVAKSGVAKFFAGTYENSLGDNNSFFSLYKINRGANGKTLESLTPIHYIYKKAGAAYYYSDSPVAPAGYTLVFNSEWITNPGENFDLNRYYYFEIPLNAGEYALGAVGEAVGAYLMYLEIGAGGSESSDNLQAYYIDTYSSTNYFPCGVDFNVPYVESGFDDGGVTTGVSIDESSNGTIVFAVSESTISISITNNTDYSSTIVFKGEDTSKYSIDIDSGSEYITDGVDDFEGETTRTIHGKVTLANGNTSLVTVIGTWANSTFTPTSYYLDGVAQQDMSNMPAIFNESALSAIVELDHAVTIEKNSGTSFDVEMTLPWANENTFDITIPQTGIEITVTYSGTYTVLINDSIVASGSTIEI